MFSSFFFVYEVVHLVCLFYLSIDIMLVTPCTLFAQMSTRLVHLESPPMNSDEFRGILHNGTANRVEYYYFNIIYILL
jgi:hypothetical protein